MDELEQGTRYRSYVPELDGLRALAIGSVLLFHLHCPGFSAGWAGVMLFFVISGFLITRILLTTRDRPNYFRNFYVRRSLRIFPIYYLTIGAYFLLLAIAPHQSSIYKAMAGTASRPLALLPYYLTYLQTIPQLRSDYNALPSLTITWTPAVEEQFYWIWPVVVAAISRRWLLPTLALLFLVGPLTRAALFTWVADRFYVVGLLPDQIDTLAMGAIVAVLVVWNLDRIRLKNWGLGCLVTGAGATLALAIRTGYSELWSPAAWFTHAQNVFLYTAMAVFFGGVVLLCVTESRLVRWLRHPVLIHIGKISYGIYLYHGFVNYAVHSLAFKAKIGSSLLAQSAVGVICLAVSYLVALASWKFIEAPINSLKARFTSPN